MIGNFPAVLNFNRLFLKLNHNQHNQNDILQVPNCSQN